MAKYIDADKLCEGLKDMAKYQVPAKQSTILGVVATIRNTRAADVEEVRHGEWVEIVSCEDVIYATCSRCRSRGKVRTNRNQWGLWNIDSPYCPKCGANMKGGK